MSAPAGPDERLVTVRRGETLWTLAQMYLGSGERWIELRDRNVGRTVRRGVVFGAEDHAVRPGWVLVVPAVDRGEDLAAAVAAVADDLDSATRERLWEVAQLVVAEALGHPPSAPQVAPYWAELVSANEGRTVTGPRARPVLLAPLSFARSGTFDRMATAEPPGRYA